MNRVSVESSNIASIGYDEASRTLEVEFLDGSVYRYSGVPLAKYNGLMDADSHGKYLNANIKGSYRYTKVS